MKLTNSGTSALTITAIALTGFNPGSFSESDTCLSASPLAAKASCVITVKFAPSTVGSLNSAVSISDNASGSPQTVALSGTGTAAPAPVASLAPTTLTFGNQAENSSSTAETVTLSNTGNATLSGITISLSEGTEDDVRRGGRGLDRNVQRNAGRRVQGQAADIVSTDYSASSTCGTTLAAGSTCTNAVTFTPTSLGSLPGTLTVTDNASNSPQTASLSGTGTAPAAPVASLSPASLTFTANTGANSAAQTATLSNTGNAALAIRSISIAGANPADFGQTNTCGASLAAGATCAISVVFTPASAVSFTATQTVADNAAGSPQTASLSETGTVPPAPIASLTPSSLTFSSNTGVASAAQTATLKNNGNAALTISGITLAGANPADFAQSNTCGASLAAGANCTISVTFTPASATSGVGSSTAFAMETGGGVDVKLSPHFALRAVQADYLLTLFPNRTDDHQKSVRLSAGVVVYFGRR